MFDLFTGQLPNEPKNNSLHKLTQSVCFNHYSITDRTSKTSIEYLTQSFALNINQSRIETKTN